MNPTPENHPPLQLTKSERIQIAKILRKDANDLAMFLMKKRNHVDEPKDLPRFVCEPLESEIDRLRRLADRVDVPPTPFEEDED